MKTTSNNGVSTNSPKGYSPVFVEVEFLKEGKEFRKFSFLTDEENLRLVKEFCRKKNEIFRNEVYTYMVDEPSYYDILFTKHYLDDPTLLFSSDYNDLFQEFSQLVLHYLSFFEGVFSFLKNNPDEVSTIFLSIDVNDETKTIVEYSVIKDLLGEDELIDNKHI